VLLDSISVLLLIYRANFNQEIFNFIQHALTGEILDKKSKQSIEAQLSS
jgi:hypothetical protein